MATNTNTENIIVNVESKYKDKGLAELKKILSGTNLAMNNMEKAGKQNSDSFIKLQARTVALNSRIEQLKKSYADVTKVSKTAHQSTEQLTGKVKGLKDSYDSLNTILTAGIIAGLGKFIGDSMRMGAELEVLRSNFVGTAQDLELFRKATAGTVTDGGLIQLSNYASDLGVSLKDQALLFSLAEDAADKYGGTVPENFERVINATDGTAKGLRAVGISTKQFNDELEKLLPTSAKTIDDLGAEEQQAIRVQAILNLTGVTIDSVNGKQQDMADKLESVNVLLKDFTANMGVGMVKSLENYLNVIGDVADATGLFNSKLVTLRDIAQIVGMSLIQSPIVTFFQIWKKEIGFTIDKINELTGLKLFQDSARGGNFSGNQGADIQITPTDQFGRPMYSPSSYIAEGGIKKPKISTSKGGSTTKRTDTLSESEKKKLAEQEAILSINSKGQAEFFELTKIKVPYTTDNKGVQPDWMAGMSDKELQSFLALNNTPSNDPSTLVDDSQTIYNNIAGLMNILNVGTDTFVSKLLAGFGTAYQILDIATSILSFIPGFGSILGKASGGMLNAGQDYIVGEQGRERIRMYPGGGGIVYNNSQTNKLMNTALNRQNPVNVYVSSNIDQRYLKVGIEKYNSNQKYIRA